MNMLITRQDKSDAKDAKALGIGLGEYKDAMAVISFSNRTVSKQEILNIVRDMKTRARIGRN